MPLAEEQNVLNGVDIRLMADKSLSGLSASDVPQLRGCITSAGDKDVLIWAKRQTVESWVRRRTEVSEVGIVGPYRTTYLITSPV